MSFLMRTTVLTLFLGLVLGVQSTPIPQQQNSLTLATFDGSKHDFKWIEENDPVMGGVSTNCTFNHDQNASVGVFEGAIEMFSQLKAQPLLCTLHRLVHSLHFPHLLRCTGVVEDLPHSQAPGFCFARTNTFFHKMFGDASSFTHLEITYRSTVAYKGFKAGFVADTLDTQFGAFKADFAVEATSSGFQTVRIPFEKFSNKWSSATGEPTKKSPPSARNLRDIRQLQLWAEGTAGPFHIELQSIAAVNSDSQPNQSFEGLRMAWDGMAKGIMAGGCSKPGACGLAYQGCCFGAGHSGDPCTCKLTDGSGNVGTACSGTDKAGACGVAYTACCVAYKVKGHPCTCDVEKP